MENNIKAILRSKQPHIPTGSKELKHLERLIEIGELDDLQAVSIPITPRYLITYMNSQTRGRIRSATVVSVTNQANRPNRVTVAYFKGFVNNSAPAGSTTFSIPPDFTVDFCTRGLPGEITTCNSVPNPELVFDEGRAIVSSERPEIGVSARVYYTEGDKDEQLLAITDSKVVNFNQANVGD
ncbi:hypothetical protein AB835_14105 [Candidatus Endobugula sertula]|uniref:Uncharacterized protein n=1 Tax=Candidatus Endobugula sertula TaxID=62101 RepID=A0A1D2QLK5_9GAMM|nr:hypothetical protein AB835_14105 [Candidatus Endobugula sertula]